MLTKLRLHNFKTFLNFESEFTRRHLLIGKNNSGKSNLCMALRFLGATATVDYATALDAVPGGVEGFCHWGLDPAKSESRVAEYGCTYELSLDGEPVKYEYGLHLRIERQGLSPSPTPISARTVREQLRVFGDGFGEALLLDSDGFAARLLNEVGLLKGGQPGSYDQSRSPVDSSMLSKTYERDTNRLLTHFKRALASSVYYSLSPPLMRHGWRLFDQPQGLATHEGLAPYGNNLPLALFQLKNQDEPRYRRVIEYLHLIEPDIDSINFYVTPDNKPVPYLIMKGGRKTSWDNLSDGSLCVLALAAIFMQTERLEDIPGWPAALIVVEEPENSLYRGVLPGLWEQLSGAAPTAQFLFTTHSPYFLDLFDHDLSSVTRVRREGSITVATPLSEFQDRIQREREESDASLGEQHFREVFG